VGESPSTTHAGRSATAGFERGDGRNDSRPPTAEPLTASPFGLSDDDACLADLAEARLGDCVFSKEEIRDLFKL
jgi:hypothetical protein